MRVDGIVSMLKSYVNFCVVRERVVQQPKKNSSTKAKIITGTGLITSRRTKCNMYAYSLANGHGFISTIEKRL